MANRASFFDQVYILLPVKEKSLWCLIVKMLNSCSLIRIQKVFLVGFDLNLEESLVKFAISNDCQKYPLDYQGYVLFLENSEKKHENESKMAAISSR